MEMPNVDVKKLAEGGISIVKEGGEYAVFAIVGAAGYAFAQPWIDRYLQIVPAVIRPAVCGLAIGIPGLYFRQKWAVGIGTGLVAYNAYAVVAPVASAWAVAARNKLAGGTGAATVQ